MSLPCEMFCRQRNFPLTKNQQGCQFRVNCYFEGGKQKQLSLLCVFFLYIDVKSDQCMFLRCKNKEQLLFVKVQSWTIIRKNDIVAALVVPKQLIYWLLKLSLFTIPPDRLKSLYDRMSVHYLAWILPTELKQRLGKLFWQVSYLTQCIIKTLVIYYTSITR